MRGSVPVRRAQARQSFAIEQHDAATTTSAPMPTRISHFGKPLCCFCFGSPLRGDIFLSFRFDSIIQKTGELSNAKHLAALSFVV